MSYLLTLELILASISLIKANNDEYFLLNNSGASKISIFYNYFDIPDLDR